MATETPSWLGEQPPVPEPRDLTAEMSALMPYLGDLTQMTSDAWLSNSNALIDTYLQNYNSLAYADAEAQTWAERWKRENDLGYLYSSGDRWNYVDRMINPQKYEQLDALSSQTAQLQSMLGTIGQPRQTSQMTTSLDQLAQQQLLTGPTSRFTNPLDQLAAQQLQTGPTTQFTGLLDKQIYDELKLGGALTPEEERMVQQSAREAYSARGMAMSDPAALTEVLNRESYSRQRQTERQAAATEREASGIERQLLGQTFASARETSDIARQQLGQQFGASREAADLAWKNFDLQQQTADQGFLLSAMGTTMAAAGTTDALNPAWKSLSLTPYTVPTSMQYVTPAPDLSTGVVSSGLGYGTDLYSSNLNLSADLYNSWMNNMASIEAANIQAAGTLAGAKTSASGAMAGAGMQAGGAVAAAAATAAAVCWVARAVYGDDNRRWRTFRAWLTLEAPRDLKDFYRCHGRGIAALVRANPAIRRAMKLIMDPITA